MHLDPVTFLSQYKFEAFRGTSKREEDSPKIDMRLLLKTVIFVSYLKRKSKNVSSEWSRKHSCRTQNPRMHCIQLQNRSEECVTKASSLIKLPWKSEDSRTISDSGKCSSQPKLHEIALNPCSIDITQFVVHVNTLEWIVKQNKQIEAKNGHWVFFFYALFYCDTGLFFCFRMTTN